jgi:hypothetical protein
MVHLSDVRSMKSVYVVTYLVAQEHAAAMGAAHSCTGRGGIYTAPCCTKRLEVVISLDTPPPLAHGIVDIVVPTAVELFRDQHVVTLQAIRPCSPYDHNFPTARFHKNSRWREQVHSRCLVASQARSHP